MFEEDLGGGGGGGGMKSNEPRRLNLKLNND